jgi:hypothetical protein
MIGVGNPVSMLVTTALTKVWRILPVDPASLHRTCYNMPARLHSRSSNSRGMIEHRKHLRTRILLQLEFPVLVHELRSPRLRMIEASEAGRHTFRGSSGLRC